MYIFLNFIEKSKTFLSVDLKFNKYVDILALKS